MASEAGQAPSSASRTGLVFDEKMMQHHEPGHPECPERISRIYEQLNKDGLAQRCLRLPARDATEAEILTVHTTEHMERMKKLPSLSDEDLDTEATQYNSIYFSKGSLESALLSCGSLLELTEAVVKGKVRNGAAVIRPPGHHAEHDCAMGFCLFNNVAVAAAVARKTLGVKRVLIIDWDVHHGNGTQHMFYEDNQILYVSLHRFDGGTFYPAKQDAGPSHVGAGRGQGYNVNVAWNTRLVGDAEYLMAFYRVIMPIATSFDPDLVFVSAGFDAARGDPLGGCNITPGGYAQMTHLLSSLAGGRVIVALEGGYNLTSISLSMAACVEVLLGDAPQLPSLTPTADHIRKAAIASIELSIQHLAPYWPLLASSPPKPAAAAAPTTPAAAAAASPAPGAPATGPPNVDELASIIADSLGLGN